MKLFMTQTFVCKICDRIIYFDHPDKSNIEHLFIETFGWEKDYNDNWYCTNHKEDASTSRKTFLEKFKDE